MQHKEYEGWTNWETWNCKLWLDNEEGTYYDMKEAAEGYADDEDSDKDTQNLAMADYVESYIDELASEYPQAGMLTDFINAGIAEINFSEIGESYMDDVREEMEAGY